MPTLSNYQQFDGIGLASGYLRNVLAYQAGNAPHTNQPPTEALLLGISGGIALGYFTFEYQGFDPHMTLLTQFLYNDDMPPKVLERLAIPQNIRQTTDGQKGMANVVSAIANGHPAVVWANSSSLKYNATHESRDNWMMQPIVIYGCEISENRVQIADRARIGLTATVDELEIGRGRIKKMRNRMVIYGTPDYSRLVAAVEAGIHDCIALLNGKSPVGSSENFGINGLNKWASALVDNRSKKGWGQQFLQGRRMFHGLLSGYESILTYATGDQATRAMFANFLDEASLILGNPMLAQTAAVYRETFSVWNHLTDSLLPTNVPLFAEARQLIDERHRLFMNEGNTSTERRIAINERLNAIHNEAETAFPLSDAQSADLRTAIRDRVLALRDVEQKALNNLIVAMAQ